MDILRKKNIHFIASVLHSITTILWCIEINDGDALVVAAVYLNLFQLEESMLSSLPIVGKFVVLEMKFYE